MLAIFHAFFLTSFFIVAGFDLSSKRVHQKHHKLNLTQTKNQGENVYVQQRIKEN